MQNINFLYKRYIKEEYYYRSIFHEHFPSDAAALCVPQSKCSVQYKIALEWDEAFKT
jgi:asparagine synthase (glutamine-hydrolysing)